MLEQIYYYNTLKEWIIVASIIVGTTILCKVLSVFNKKVLQKLVAKTKTKTKFDGLILRKLNAPFLIFLMLIAFFVCFNRLNYSPELIKAGIIVNGQKVFIVLFGLVITWAVSRFCTGIFDSSVRRIGKPDLARLLPFLKRVIAILIWGIGIMMILNNIGMNIMTILSALGIGGLAVALATQDTIKNIIGGISLISDRSFKIGDRVKFNGIDGTIEDIGLRSTIIRTLDKRAITVPNATILDASIENVSGEVGRRIVANIRLTYDTTPDKLKQAIGILKRIQYDVKYIDSTDFSATFQNFDDSALIITLIYFIRKSSPDVMESISEVNFYILENFNKENINFAFPTQTIFMGEV